MSPHIEEPGKKKKRRSKRLKKLRIVFNPDYLPLRFRRKNGATLPVSPGPLDLTFDGGASYMAVADYSYNPATYGRIYAKRDSCMDQVHPGPPYRSGGPLWVFSYSDPYRIVGTGTYYGLFNSTIWYRYRGGFVPSLKPRDLETWAMALDNEIDNPINSAITSMGDVGVYGAKAWNKFAPGSSSADLGVFLGESMEIPRMLMNTAKLFHGIWRSMGGSLTSFTPKSVANQWLNTQFGWKPFIRDLQDFYSTATTLDKKVQQIIKDNGQWIRRRGTVEKGTIRQDVLASSSVNTLLTPTLPAYFYPNPSSTGSYTLLKTYYRKVWFEGAFRYWIPAEKLASPNWSNRAILDIFGATPCPSLVWNLIPWSWLVDWFSNVGDVFSNLTPGYADNLTAKYAYLMGTTNYLYELTTTHNLYGGPVEATFSYPITWKRRQAASPFGFGLTGNDFTPRQWSILGALGLTRGLSRY